MSEIVAKTGNECKFLPKKKGNFIIVSHEIPKNETSTLKRHINRVVENVLVCLMLSVHYISCTTWALEDSILGFSNIVFNVT